MEPKKVSEPKSEKSNEQNPDVLAEQNPDVLGDQIDIGELNIIEGDDPDNQDDQLDQDEDMFKEIMLYTDLYSKEIKVGDIFLILFFIDYKNFEDEIHDVVCEIVNINKEEHTITISGNDLLITTLDITDDLQIILNTEDYKILDIEKIDEMEEKELEDLELKLTKSYIKEIVFEDIITEDKNYTDNEKKEELLSELIQLLNAYNNEKLLKEITDMCEYFLILIREKLNNNLNNKDVLSFIKGIINDNKLKFPKYIKPVVKAKRNIYAEESPDQVVDEINLIDLSEELTELQRILETPEVINMNYRDHLNVDLNDNYTNYQINENNKKFITEYEGEYLRDCLFEETCIGAKVLIEGYGYNINTTSVLQKKYSYDNVRTKNKFLISLLKNNKTEFEILKNNEKINLTGLILFPSKFLYHANNLKMDSKLFTLEEISFYNNMTYSYEIFKETFNNENVVPKNIDINTRKIDDYNEELLCYWFDNIDNIDLESFGNILKENLPNKRDIISNISKIFINNIYDIRNFEKLVSNYEITFDGLDQEMKAELIDIIDKNIKTYLREYKKIAKPKEIKKIKVTLKKLNKIERSEKSLKYISKLINIRLKNLYYRKYIDLFLRTPEGDENKNYLYNRYSNKQGLCKHYLHLVNIDKDSEKFNEMINVWKDDDVKDGYICCKNCGEYLCNEGFSEFQGFSDGKPVNTNEKMDKKEDDILNDLTDEQIKNKELILKFQGFFDISLHQVDIKYLLDILDTIDAQVLTSNRYNELKNIEAHPMYKKIKEKYSIKKDTPKKEKAKFKRLLKEGITLFQEYLKTCNNILSILYLIILFVQTAIPSYGLKVKYSIIDIDDCTSIRSCINHGMLTLIEKVLINYSEMYKGDKLWDNISRLLNESSEYGLKNIYNHFVIVIEYFQSNFFIINRKNKYKDYLLHGEKSSFIKDQWSSYKPLLDNELVNRINTKVDDDKTLTMTDKKIENNALMNEINNIRVIEKYKELDITISEFMNNESYKRLCKYSLQLYGKSKQKNIIDLLINRLINTTENSGVENKLESLGLEKIDETRWTLKKIDYDDFRNIICIEIPNLYKGQGEDEDIGAYHHINFNNFDLRILSGHAKKLRVYKYNPSNIFPVQSYGELKEKDTIIKKIFEQYCLDEFNNIIKINEKNYLNYLLLDLDEEREIENNCITKLKNTEENFELYLKNIRGKNKFSYPNNFEIQRLIYDKAVIDGLELNNIKNNIPFTKLVEFINKNKYTEYETDLCYDKFNGLLELNDEITSMEYLKDEVKKKAIKDKINIIIDQLIDDTDGYKDTITESLQRILRELDNIKQIRRLEKYHGLKLNSKIKGEQVQIIKFKSISIKIVKALESILDNDNKEIKINYIKQIFTIISRLKNKGKKRGTIFHNDISFFWKMSKNNVSILKDFIGLREFLIHEDIFSTSKDFYHGFNLYRGKSQYFKKLFEYMNEYQKDIESIIGIDSNEYFIDNEKSNIIINYIFVFIINKYIEYLNELRDDESDASTEAIELLRLLEKGDIENKANTITYCSSLLIDLLQNIVEEVSDPTYVHENKDKDIFGKEMAKQKEREKQFLVGNLTSMSNEQRLLNMEKERIGLSKWHHNLSKKNEEYKNSEQYHIDNDEERIRRLQANSEDFESVNSMFAKEGIDLDEMMNREVINEEVGSYDDGNDPDNEDGDIDHIDGYDN